MLSQLSFYELIGLFENKKGEIDSAVLADPKVFEVVIAIIRGRIEEKSFGYHGVKYRSSRDTVKLLSALDGAGEKFLANPENFKIALPLIKEMRPHDRMHLLCKAYQGGHLPSHIALIRQRGIYPLIKETLKADIDAASYDKTYISENRWGMAEDQEKLKKQHLTKPQDPRDSMKAHDIAYYLEGFVFRDDDQVEPLINALIDDQIITIDDIKIAKDVMFHRYAELLLKVKFKDGSTLS